MLLNTPLIEVYRNGFYVLHYPVLAVIAFIGQLYLDVPMICHYMINLVSVVILLQVVYEVIGRIPVVRFLVLGVTKSR